MSATDQQIQQAKETAELGGKMDLVLARLDKVEEKLDGVVAMTNRWKGATALLIVLGGLVGYFSNVALKLIGKA